jgi:hypothetical protein
VFASQGLNARQAHGPLAYNVSFLQGLNSRAQGATQPSSPRRYCHFGWERRQGIVSIEQIHSSSPTPLPSTASPPPQCRIVRPSAALRHWAGLALR